ncbi:hypothetical protein GDO81_001976 [Engystomops pustulosus]|uniref:Uncharacterized protein n=1 Tax=Engystomops pustulosus TaxID=76066 RepID=A0AAV7DGH5_ENGPU|nr:hypothetical protein GDO81_001976 [Engystomops pustulosus]
MMSLGRDRSFGRGPKARWALSSSKGESTGTPRMLLNMALRVLSICWLSIASGRPRTLILFLRPLFSASSICSERARICCE